jgi:phosphatidate cytidylyltransferase
MKKVIQRLLIFFVSVPLILIIVLWRRQFNHLVFNLLVVVFTALGAVELSAMLTHKNNVNTGKTTGGVKITAAVLGALMPVSAVLTVCFGINVLVIPVVFTAAVLWLLVTRIFSQGETLNAFIGRLTTGFTLLIYPGFLMIWLIALSRFENAGVIILTFVFTVFASDSTAWAAGMLFGKGNRGIVPVSPNKSVAGFIGGAFGTVVIGVGAVLIQPDVFVLQACVSGIPGGAITVGALLALLTGIAATAGDLAESAIKRSSGMDDSGSIIPGRGGVLDSIDSVAFAAPVVYLLSSLLFAFS